MTFNMQTVSLRKAGQILGRSAPFMQRLVNNGHLRSIKVGTRRMIHMSEIERFMREGNYIPKDESNDTDSEAQTFSEETAGLREGNLGSGRPIEADEIRQPNQKGGYTLEEADGGKVPQEEGSGTGGGRNSVSDFGSDRISSGNSQSPRHGNGSRSDSPGGVRHNGVSDSGRDSSSGNEGGSDNSSAPLADDPYPPYLKNIIKRGAV